MNNTKVIVVREAFEWLEVHPEGDFLEQDLKELIRYLSRAYPKAEYWELGLNRVRFINVVGTIRLSRVQIDIIPKFELQGEGILALQNMLTVCGHVPYRTLENNSRMQFVQMDLLTWIASAYCRELEDQMRRGVPAGYVQVEDNSLRLRGRVVLPHHLRRNSADKTRVYCAFDERTTDIPLNQVLFKAVTVLLRKSSDASIRKKLKQLLVYFEDVSEPYDLPTVLGSVRFDRLQSRFESAFRLAKLILSRMSLLQRGAQEDCLSFLFDASLLYESYIGCLLKQMTEDLSLTVHLQHEEVKLLRNEDTGHENVQLKPDIVVGRISQDGHQEWNAILDTKWKRASIRKEDDIYQLYAYVTGYSEATHAVLVYPRTADDSKSMNWSLMAFPGKRIMTRTVRILRKEETQEDLREILQELQIQDAAAFHH